jgi:hypothetical protein
MQRDNIWSELRRGLVRNETPEGLEVLLSTATRRCCDQRHSGRRCELSTCIPVSKPWFVWIHFSDTSEVLSRPWGAATQCLMIA